jgi:hypothetical protein
LFILCWAVSGCKAPLNYDKATDLEPGAEVTLTIDGPSSDQKVKIDISCPDPIDVSVWTNDKKAPLVKKTGVKNESFELTIPAKQSFTISLSSMKQTTASVKAKSL